MKERAERVAKRLVDDASKLLTQVKEIEQRDRDAISGQALKEVKKALEHSKRASSIFARRLNRTDRNPRFNLQEVLE